MKNFKNLKTIAILILVFMFFACMTACSGTANSSGQQNDAQQSVENTSAPENASTPEAATAEESIPAADSKASADQLIGSWKDISDENNFTNITKTDTGYQYEDNDGEYSATFENGVLKVKASDSDTAEVYIDPKTGHLLTLYQGGLTEYEKK